MTPNTLLSATKAGWLCNRHGQPDAYHGFRRLVAALDADDPSLVMLPDTAQVAAERGYKHYFTGKPCKRGHVDRRKAFGRNCVACNLEYEKSPERREYRREYEKLPKARLYSREYQKLPNALEYHREYSKIPKMREYKREHCQRRDAAKRNATPPWLTDQHIEDMRAIYAEAQRLTDETGIPHHVDHIIPLTHPDVQGLHVPWNLQILTAEDNIRKSNSFDGTHDNEGWRQSRS